MHDYRKLNVWEKSIEMSTKIYRVTKDFPTNEIYGLTSQLRRSAVSIPSNIAEGAGRGTDKGFVAFLRIAFGSLN